MLKMQFRDAVVTLLKDRPASLKLKQVSEDTTIPEGWLKRLARGRIEEPSGPRLHTLYDYLNVKKLEF